MVLFERFILILWRIVPENENYISTTAVLEVFTAVVLYFSKDTLCVSVDRRKKNGMKHSEFRI